MAGLKWISKETVGGLNSLSVAGPLRSGAVSHSLVEACLPTCSGCCLEAPSTAAGCIKPICTKILRGRTFSTQRRAIAVGRRRYVPLNQWFDDVEKHPKGEKNARSSESAFTL